LKLVLRNPYLWIVVGYVFSALFLTKILMFILYLIGVQLNQETYKNFTDFMSGEEVLKAYSIFGLQIIKFILVLVLVYKTNLFLTRKICIRKKDFLYALYTLILKMVISVGTVAIFAYIGIDTAMSTPNQEKFDAFMMKFVAFGVIYGVICAPIIEEFIFRKVMLGHIFKEKKYIGLIISTILFSFLHFVSGFSLSGLIMYTSLGLVFGWLYIKTGRIETTIIIHMINNLITILMVNI